MTRDFEEYLQDRGIGKDCPDILEIEKRFNERKREWDIQEWARRGIPKRYFDASWDNWIADTKSKELALKEAKGAWEKNLFFTGKNGTGKTHLAMCLAKDGAAYRRLPDIFREVRTDFAKEGEVLENYGNENLLIIDEIGRQKFSDFEINLFFEIIDRRWNNVKMTTIITNLSPQEFSDVYGTAVIDRLRPTIVNFTWESMRD